jgi:hypothetical protein
MAAITVTDNAVAGVALPFVAATVSGDTLRTAGNVVLFVRNSDASAKTVTIVRPGNDAYGQAIPDIPVIVAAGATAAIGPIPGSFADPADSLVDITYSAVTAVTVAALRVS